MQSATKSARSRVARVARVARAARPAFGTSRPEPIAALLAWVALLAPASAQDAVRAPSALSIDCTPDSLRVSGEAPIPTRFPLCDALERAAPGCQITLQPGDYGPLKIGFDSRNDGWCQGPGGRPGQPVVVRGLGRVTLHPDGDGDTISVNQAVECAWIRFENLVIEPGYRAGIFFFELGGGRVHRGFEFADCDVLGTWDHAAHAGAESKWAVWGHSLADFTFAGRARRARIEKIHWEHGFYLQNCRGDVTIENVDARELGRTFLQLTSRASDGPPASGTVSVRDCSIADIGLSRDDDWKGGAAITIAGGMPDASVRLERVRYRAGFDPRLRHLTRPEVPYGTAALVAWDGGEALPNGTLVLEGCDFEFAPGCGDRPVVSIGACREVQLVGSNRIVAGAAPVALELDPRPRGAAPRHPCGAISLSDASAIRGRIELRGRQADAAALEELARPRPPAPGSSGGG
jgi:hypothetical protein